ncbi:MAG: hypothetical protein ABH842_02945 [Candidatus Micrarchaeota archaeon]
MNGTTKRLMRKRITNTVNVHVVPWNKDGRMTMRFDIMAGSKLER